MLFWFENLQAARAQKSGAVKVRVVIHGDNQISHFLCGNAVGFGFDDICGGDEVFFAHSGELVMGGR